MHKQQAIKSTKSKSHLQSKKQHSKRSLTTSLKKKLTNRSLPRQTPITASSSQFFSSLGFSWPVSKQLDGVVNYEKFATQPTEMIDQLWSDYHAASSTATGLSITSNQFEKLKQRGAHCTFFIHPVARDAGFFVMLSQYQDKSFLITYLEDFKKDSGNAQPYMTVTIYDELQHSKDLVLVRSDICALATLNKQDSDHLTRTLIASYCDDDLYANNVFKFNKTPHEFNFDDYVKNIVAQV